KRTRSTRRRRDVPDLPKRRMAPTTLGRTFTGTGGKTYRPSLFLSLTLPSYGKVRDGVPVDPDRYDYRKAARDALHFAKLVDRFVQNLRRVAGYDVQYFATVEPQKRLAPHLHMAIRGTLPRAEIRQIVAATYHQVWWPPTGEVRFEGEHLPVWTEGAGYVDPGTGEVLPTWDEALDALDADEDAEPLHVIRFGDQLDVQGVLAGTRDADQCIRYLTKYLTKSLGEAFAPVGEDDDPQRRAQAAHAARLLEALRYEPCSPTCANWLRYGIQPKNAKPGMIPGRCRGKAHTPDHLGYAGRRVLVSRKWSNKTLTEHKHDRRAFVLNLLGLTEEQAADPHRYLWRIPSPGDPDVPPRHARLRAGSEPATPANPHPKTFRQRQRRRWRHDATSRRQAHDRSRDPRRTGRDLGPHPVPLARDRQVPAWPAAAQRRDPPVPQRVRGVVGILAGGVVTTSYKVKFWGIRTNTRPQQGKKPRVVSHTVRWTVAGREKSSTFKTKGLAESFLSSLRQAAKNGEAFDVETGLPASLMADRDARTWYALAVDYVRAMWPHAAAKTRAGMTEALAVIVPVLVKDLPGRPEADVLRRALLEYALLP